MFGHNPNLLLIEECSVIGLRLVRESNDLRIRIREKTCFRVGLIAIAETATCFPSTLKKVGNVVRRSSLREAGVSSMGAISLID